MAHELLIDTLGAFPSLPSEPPPPVVREQPVDVESLFAKLRDEVLFVLGTRFIGRDQLGFE